MKEVVPAQTLPCFGRTGSVQSHTGTCGFGGLVAERACSLLGDISVPCKGWTLRPYLQNAGLCGISPGACATQSPLNYFNPQVVKESSCAPYSGSFYRHCPRCFLRLQLNLLAVVRPSTELAYRFLAILVPKHPIQRYLPCARHLAGFREDSVNRTDKASVPSKPSCSQAPEKRPRE